LDLALPQQQVFDGLEGTSAALWGIEGVPLWGLEWYLQQCQKGWQHRLQGTVERQQLACDLLTQAASVVPGFDAKIALEEVNDRQVGGGLAIGHGVTG